MEEKLTCESGRKGCERVEGETVTSLASSGTSLHILFTSSVFML